MNFLDFDTEFGSGCFVWRGEILYAVFLPSTGVSAENRMKDTFPHVLRKHSSFADETAIKLSGMAAGKHACVSPESLDFGNISNFKKVVLQTLSTIPRGQTISYAGLAEKAGYSGAARAVGSVMSSNPFPLIIPCHRVVRADGSVGSYQGGTVMKKFLLEAELD